MPRQFPPRGRRDSLRPSLLANSAPPGAVPTGIRKRHPPLTPYGLAYQRVMLSVKHSSLLTSVPTEPSKCLTDLPNEVLHAILHYVYHDSGEHITSILPISRTCQHMRAATHPYLFSAITIKTDEDVIAKQSWDLLRNLVSNPHYLQHVRSLQVQALTERPDVPDGPNMMTARVGSNMSRNCLRMCLGLMDGLLKVRFFCLSDLNLEILGELRHLRSLEVSLDMSATCESVPLIILDRLRELLLTTPNWKWSISLPESKHIQSVPKVATTLASGNISALNWLDNSSALQVLVSSRRNLSFLTELHVSSKTFDVQGHLLSPGFIPWLSLKRLHVEGDEQIKHLMQTTISKLICLEDLNIQASTPDAFHEDCAHNAYDIIHEPLPFTSLPNLRRLTIRGMCIHIHLRDIATPNLESLSVTIQEQVTRQRNMNELRHPIEVRWLAYNLPRLQHLELHIGPLENLWNPTAIPGVDVNVEVYSMLHAISQIRHLKSLRLYPAYMPRTSERSYSIPRQPIPDEQAIRVFHYLRAMRPSLNILSIAPTFSEIRRFSPMSWTVRDGGNGKTILTTRQAERDYDLEQVWIGKSRIRMNNVRHSYKVPFLIDFEAYRWTLPVGLGFPKP